MQQSLLADVYTPVRKRRGLMRFDSRESAIRWSVRNRPRTPAGAVCVGPPRAVRDGEAWVLRYPVGRGGYVTYETLTKSVALAR